MNPALMPIKAMVVPASGVSGVKPSRTMKETAAVISAPDTPNIPGSAKSRLPSFTADFSAGTLFTVDASIPLRLNPIALQICNAMWRLYNGFAWEARKESAQQGQRVELLLT